MAAGENRKEKILIADDSEMNRAILVDILGEDYDALEAADGAEAVKILQEEGQGISLLLLDLNMPRLDGFQVLEVMNKSKLIEDVPVIIISAENASAIAERAFNSGVIDFISRPFDAVIVRRRVQNTLALRQAEEAHPSRRGADSRTAEEQFDDDCHFEPHRRIQKRGERSAHSAHTDNNRAVFKGPAHRHAPIFVHARGDCFDRHRLVVARYRQSVYSYRSFK